MNNLKILVSGLALLAWSTQTMAQNEVDALRYSQLGFGGTARIQGMAGAQTALGADASTMAGNPAGLGLYRKGEFTISPGFNFNKTESTLGNTVTPDSKNNFNISQLGVVFTDRKADDVVNNWRSGSFGIGFTRLNSFQMQTSYEGQVADERGLAQSLAESTRRQNLTYNDLLDETAGGNNIFSLEGLAFATYLIDFDDTGEQPFAYRRTGPIAQREVIESSGAQNQWDFSYGASYQDKLFIGGSLSLVNVRYEQQRNYSETAATDSIISITLTDRFTTKGSGINFRVGLIYKPTDALRMGASIQTPTFMSLTDNYNTAMVVNYKPGTIRNTTQTQFISEIVPGVYEYNLTTPFRANGGLAYFIGKVGFISADAEFVNYGGASYNQDNDFAVFSAVNNRISNTYQGAMNYRLGGEARFDIFRVRGGFAFYGDPYRASSYERGRKYFTTGIGIKESTYFVDAAYIYTTYNSYYSPYSLNNNLQPVVETNVNNTNFVITAGFNF